MDAAEAEAARRVPRFDIATRVADADAIDDASDIVKCDLRERIRPMGPRRVSKWRRRFLATSEARERSRRRCRVLSKPKLH